MKHFFTRHHASVLLSALLLTVLLVCLAGFAQAEEHQYPISGTPTLALTVSRTTAPTNVGIEVQVQRSASSLTFWHRHEGDCYSTPGSIDYLSGSYVMNCSSSSAWTEELWAEDSNGAFSGIARLTWTSDGQLADATNIRINGVPYADWTQGFVVRVPYTVTVDPVANATDYLIGFNTDSNYVNFRSEGAGQTSIMLMFDQTSTSTRVNSVEASAIGYDTSYVSDQRDLGPIVLSSKAQLSLQASASVGADNDPITFSVQSSASAATLCYQCDRWGSPIKTLPMTKAGNTFTAVLSSLDDLDTMYTAWVADSDQAVSDTLPIRWQEPLHQYPTGTPTMTLTASGTKAPTNTLVQFDVSGGTSSSVTFWYKRAGSCQSQTLWMDPSTGTCQLTYNPGVGCTITIWVEDENQNFSNPVTVTWESVGKLAQPQNICINGVPYENWSESLVAGVPYWITSDKLDHATEYCAHFQTSGNSIHQTVLTEGAPSITVVFKQQNGLVVLQSFTAAAIGYDQSNAFIDKDLRTVTASAQAPLTLDASSAVGSNSRPITFTLQSSASEAYLCYERMYMNGEITILPMTKVNGSFTAVLNSLSDFSGQVRVWAADSSKAVSPEQSIEWAYQEPPRPYPSGTPSLELTASAHNVLTCTPVSFAVAAEHDVTLWFSNGIASFNEILWGDGDTGIFRLDYAAKWKGTYDIWAEDAVGNFSNKVTVEWTSAGPMAQMTNLRINGTPIAQWTDDFVIGIPYTLTMDPVANATKYQVSFSTDHTFYTYETEASGTPSIQFAFAEETSTQVSLIEGEVQGVGYDASTIAAIPLSCEIVSSTLTSPELTSSALFGYHGRPITFELKSSAASATLCYQLVSGNTYSLRMVPMTQVDGIFTADLDDPEMDYDSYDIWAVDSTGAVSDKVWIDWIESQHQYPTSGTPTLTLQASTQSPLTGEFVEFSAASSEDAMTLWSERSNGYIEGREMAHTQEMGVFRDDAFNVSSCVERFWIEAPSGAFSDIITVEWTAPYGDMPQAENVRINGILTDDWQQDFIAGVPYTITFDPVPGLSQVELTWTSDWNYFMHIYQTASDSVYQIIFPQAANGAGLETICLFGIGYDQSYTSFRMSGSSVVTAPQPLTLDASSTMGGSASPITFTVESTADSASLCLWNEMCNETFILPMNAVPNGFELLVDTNPLSCSHYTVWVADSNDAVSQQVAITWTEGSAPTPSFVLTLPAGLKTIEAEAFMGVPAEVINVPNGCTTIGSSAFADCEILLELHLPATVTSIAADALSGCTFVTLYGPAGSYAEAYAAQNDFPFIIE